MKETYCTGCGSDLITHRGNVYCPREDCTYLTMALPAVLWGKLFYSYQPKDFCSEGNVLYADPRAFRKFADLDAEAPARSYDRWLVECDEFAYKPYFDSIARLTGVRLIRRIP